MKNLIITFATILLAATATFASVTPESIIAEKEVEVMSVENTKIFTAATYNQTSQNLEFTTQSDIEFIQIYDAQGNVAFQLPVQSNIVKINKNLFDKGVSKLGFKMDQTSETYYTSVKVN